MSEEIEQLNAELERERMRLAACGVVALANTEESATKARLMHDDYRSASCDDVVRMVDVQMKLRTQVEQLNAEIAMMSEAIAVGSYLLQGEREHISSVDCWCKPYQDDQCPDVWIHNELPSGGA